jgi:hypothetical protein
LVNQPASSGRVSTASEYDIFDDRSPNLVQVGVLDKGFEIYDKYINKNLAKARGALKKIGDALSMVDTFNESEAKGKADSEKAYASKVEIHERTEGDDPTLTLEESKGTKGAAAVANGFAGPMSHALQHGGNARNLYQSVPAVGGYLKGYFWD